VYTHVIVPFDGEEQSRRAAGLGADLSHLFGSRLVVVTATNSDKGAALLKEKAQRISGGNVDVWVEPNNRPVDAIATTVKFRPRSLVVMATSARQGVRRAVYGSVAEAVVRRVDVPVMLLGPHFPEWDVTDIRQLLVCVDGSATAQSALPLAVQWAQRLELPIVLYNAHRPDDEGTSPADLEALAALLEPVVPRVEVRQVTSKDPTTSIVNELAPSSCTLAIMTTHARAGVDRQRNGSQVMRVVERSKLPVLVLRAGAKLPEALPEAPPEVVAEPDEVPAEVTGFGAFEVPVDDWSMDPIVGA
jgi:nucleotide-binding universal stress UspA family protein